MITELMVTNGKTRHPLTVTRYNATSQFIVIVMVAPPMQITGMKLLQVLDLGLLYNISVIHIFPNTYYL